MTRGIYTIASGGLAAQSRLDAVAQNVANAGTAGYKAQRVSFSVRPLMRFGSLVTGPLAAQTTPQVVEVAQRRDFSPGSLVVTGNPLDVAVTGQGLFTVSTPRGERYTRQGTFAVDGEGFLVTAAGDRVQGDGGDIAVGRTGEVQVADDGTVSADGSRVGQLKLVDFGEDPALVGEGNALFAPVAGLVGTPLDASQVQVQQGAIERANVDVVSSLVEMVDVARGYESYMKAMQRLDEIAKRSIDEVGRVG